MKLGVSLLAVLAAVTLRYTYWRSPYVDNFDPDMEYDYVIVGGGTSGCILANRLSRDPQKRVLVVEAGDYPGGWTGFLSRVPLAVPFLMGSGVDWQYWTTGRAGTMKALRQGRFQLPAGRVFGGTSGINAMVYTRGLEGDFNFPGWRDRERFYNRSICQNRTADNCLRLSECPSLGKLTEAFLQAGGESKGFVRPQVSVHDGTRVSMFDAFIRPIMGRANFYRLTKTVVRDVMIEDRQGVRTAYGVTARTERGDKHRILVRQGGEVILSSGAIATPKILLASGIGRRDQLQKLKIDQLVDLPVGEYVQDHPFMGVYFTINQTLSLTTRKIVSPVNVLSYLLHGEGPLSLASGLTGIGYVSLDNKPSVVPYSSHKRDIELLSFGVGSIINDKMKQISNFDDQSWELFKPPEYAKSEEGFLINVILLRPKSHGRLLIDNLDQKPIVDTGHLSSPSDIEDLVTGVQFTLDLIESSPLYRSMGTRAHLPVYPACEGLAARSREAVRCLVRHVSVGMYHVTSSCRMGEDPRRSVVDLSGRVHGVRSLRIADASVLPNVPSAHPMAEVMVVAERLSEIIVQQSEP